MGCVNGTDEGEAAFRSPERGNPVLLGGSPSSSERWTPKEHKLLLDDALEMLPLDTTVTFSSYFRVGLEKREEWRRSYAVLRKEAEERDGSLFHRASYSEEFVHLRGTFADAAAMLGHLRRSRHAFHSLLELSSVERMEVLGPHTELDKVGREAAALGGRPCAVFELRPDSIRRESDDPWEAEGIVSVDHYFQVSERDLPVFKCCHCASFAELAGGAPGLRRHSVSFSSGLAHLSEDFADAEAALLHLQAASWAYCQAQERCIAFSLEVHGPEKELEALRGWLAMASAKQIEAEDMDRPDESPGSFRLAEPWSCGQRRAGEDGMAREIVVQLLSKATLFDLGSSRTIPCARIPEAAERRTLRKVLFADPPVESEEPSVLQLHLDTAVVLVACFSVEPEKLEGWKECCEAMSRAAEAQESALHHGVSYGEGSSQVHAAFRDAAALLEHFQRCEEALQAMVDLSTTERIEVHAPRAELAKVRRAWPRAAPLLSLLELAPDGLRADRPHSGRPGSDSIVSLCYHFRVQESDLPHFKRSNCGVFRAMAQSAVGLEHHGISFGGDVLQLRQGFTDAHAALAHIRSLASARVPAFDSAVAPSLHLHGPAKEVEKIRCWALAAASPTCENDAEASMAASLLAKASMHVLDGRAFRRTSVRRAAPAERHATAAAAGLPLPRLPTSRPLPPPPEEPPLATSPPPPRRSYPAAGSDQLASSFVTRQSALEAALDAAALEAALDAAVEEECMGQLSAQERNLMELRDKRSTVFGGASGAEGGLPAAQRRAARQRPGAAGAPRTAGAPAGASCSGSCIGILCH